MLTIGRIILKFFANIFFVRNKEYFIKKNGLKGIKLILFLVSYFPKIKKSLLFKISGSDKYEQYYDLYNILDSIKNNNNKYNILEIGIGGHDKKYSGGNSLIALESIFRKSNIIGFDYEDKKFLESKRIFVFQGDQSKVSDLEKVTNKFNQLDIIIDDGSHFVDHQLISFEYLFKYLNDGGVYIIEDIQGSYVKCMNGDPELNKEKNLISYFSDYAHCVNHKFILDKFKEKYEKFFGFEKLMFVENAILIQKKKSSKLKQKYPESEMYLSLDEMNRMKKRIKEKSGIIRQSN